MTIQKICLIDDDIIVNTLNRIIFKNAGFKGHLQIYENPQSAINEISHLNKDEFPDLIFLDINMEPLSGWEVLDEFSSMSQDYFPKCKVILLSSSINEIEIERSKGYKIVCDFISKPITIDQVEALIMNSDNL